MSRGRTTLFKIKRQVFFGIHLARDTHRHSNTGNRNAIKKKKSNTATDCPKKLSNLLLWWFSNFNLSNKLTKSSEWLRHWVGVCTRWSSEIFSKVDSYTILWNYHMKEVGSDGLVRKSESCQWFCSPRGAQFQLQMPSCWGVFPSSLEGC